VCNNSAHWKKTHKASDEREKEEKKKKKSHRQ
jgi:hypothetical protein